MNSELRSQRVGALRPNAFGLFDMHGNVQEFVEDLWATIYNNPRKGLGNVEVLRVARGGSWVDSASGVRSARRWGIAPQSRSDHIGLRVARALGP